MSEARLSAGFSWPATVAGIVLTVAIMAGLATAIRVSAPDKKLTFAPKAPGLEIVQLERLSRLDQTREKLELLDQTPLFLPRSGLAAGSVPATLTDRPGGRVGELYAASLVFQERGAGREILASSGPKSPLEGFGAVTQGRWFLGLARRDQDEAASPLSPRAARVEIYRLNESSPEAVLELAGFAETAPAGWKPIELSLLVTPVGVVARPGIVTGSGSEEMDERIRTLLTTELLLKVRLRSGIYRVLVGP